MPKVASITDYRALAKRRIPHFLFEYIDGGAYAEVTLKRNVEDLERVALRQRVLKDVSKIDLAASILGQKFSMPIALAPIGLAGLNARRGECQAVRAASKAGVPFCLSTVSLCSLAEVAASAEAPFWFQLYMIRDRGYMTEALREARRVKCSALLFTVDLPVFATRYRDMRSGLAGAQGPMGALRRAVQVARRPAWAIDVGLNGRPHQLGNLTTVVDRRAKIPDFVAWVNANFDPATTWKDLDFIRQTWDGPLMLKGILDAEDARRAASLGVQGIVVSNHGGRQLDGVPSSAAALPKIADAVADRITVLADGGVRSGLDVVRMLALGAKGVLVGRAWAFALAARGGAGVSHVLKLLEAEMRVAMALTGCTNVGEITRDVLVGAGT